MRLEDGISNQLINMNFQTVGTNINSIHLFYRAVNTEEVIIVVFFHALYGTELTTEEYELLLTNIKSKFLGNGFYTIHLLGLIFTGVPDRAKRFCIDQDDHWLIDLSGKRLIIYENQTSDFYGLKEEIERLFEDENYSTDLKEALEEENIRFHGRYMADPKRVRWVSVINTIIIAANIIVFLLVHYTKLFGETDQVMTGGALSWYFVKEEREYYRMMTSMFLHNDFGHLLNNMLVLFFVGDNLERAAGKLKFLFIYFGSGLLAGISSIGYNMIKNSNVFSIGASGAIFGIVGAMGYILAVNKGRLEDISGRQILLFTIFSLYGGISSANIDNAAHIGGLLSGILLALILYRKPKKKNYDKETDYA